jgi:serine/threonine-protein kinase
LGSTVAETLEQVKSLEPLSPLRLQPKTPRDLETICLKCLEKDPGRRYAAAADLADDLRRFLEGRPIAARPVTRLGRAYRWGRRNPWLAGLASALVLSLLGGLTVSTTQWLRAERNLIRANRARDVAYDRFELALDAIKSFYTGASEDVILKENRLTGLRRKLLQSPLEFYEKLTTDLQSDDDVDEKRQGHLMGEAYYRLAEVTADIGSKEDALNGYQHALRIRETLARGGLADDQLRRDLAVTYTAIGKLQLLTGRPDEAIRSHRQALATLDEMSREHPGDRRLKHDRARSFINIGTAQSGRGLSSEALRSYQEATTILEAIHADRPEDARFIGDIAKTYFDVGFLEGQSGQPDAALRSFQQAREMIEPLVESRPDTYNLEIIGAIYNSVGINQKYQGRLTASQQALERARGYRMRLIADHPTSTVYQHALADTLVNLGVVDEALGRSSEAVIIHQQARGTLMALLKDNPKDARSQRSLAGCLTFLASLQQKRGELDQALRSLGEARRLFEGLLPSTPDTLYNLACVLAQHVPIIVQTRPNSEAEQRHYADLAMDALQRAFSSGFKNLAVARRDPDLASLRSRADFQALIYDPGFPADPFKAD